MSNLEVPPGDGRLNDVEDAVRHLAVPSKGHLQLLYRHGGLSYCLRPPLDKSRPEQHLKRSITCKSTNY